PSCGNFGGMIRARATGSLWLPPENVQEAQAKSPEHPVATPQKYPRNVLGSPRHKHSFATTPSRLPGFLPIQKQRPTLCESAFVVGALCYGAAQESTAMPRRRRMAKYLALAANSTSSLKRS